ncbi:DUF4238 domain-containing protein [Parachitinimonas caeni]|uniref:DUF4238 domain-containing protein n=1 Tax=Parachitinimonas caeni TaxID=3031301 RepID=A0ABT7DWP0_9NEIS|nr:DUF4238 domain-containing protein [Parachitinimonas caeni]MDK2124470.1 DUF4238 domain-containing protein [Parachitinimonas caeni]
MPAYENQHYVPICLLKNWCGSRHTLWRYCWKNGRLVFDPKGPRKVGFKKHTSNYHNLPGRDATEPEQRLGREVDTPASLVLGKLQSCQLQDLSNQDQLTWWKFIASLRARHPCNVDRYFRSRAQKLYEELARPFLDPKYGSWLWDSGRDLNRLEYINQLLRLRNSSLIHWTTTMGKVGGWLFDDMHSQLINTQKPLLLGDYPLVENDLSWDAPMYTGTLPISPYRVFLFSSRAIEWVVSDLDQMTHDINRYTVEDAEAEVYADSADHRDFVERYLRKPPC